MKLMIQNTHPGTVLPHPTPEQLTGGIYTIYHYVKKLAMIKTKIAILILPSEWLSGNYLPQCPSSLPFLHHRVQR